MIEAQAWDDGQSNEHPPTLTRLWHLWAGGKDYFPIDEFLSDLIQRNVPDIEHIARVRLETRGRLVRYLVELAGISQFLVIDSDLPFEDEVHQVAQRVARHARTVYAGTDPHVMVHARSMLKAQPPGACGHIDAGLTEPEKLLGLAAQTLDLHEPVGVLAFNLEHLSNPEPHLQALMASLAPGSHLAVTALTDVIHESAMGWMRAVFTEYSEQALTLRKPAHLTTLFNGLVPVEPGVVSCPDWQPDLAWWHPPVDLWCGVGAKPEPGHPSPLAPASL